MKTKIMLEQAKQKFQEKNGADIVMVMLDLVEAHKDNGDPLIFIVPNVGSFSTNDYLKRYGMIDISKVRGWILELPNWEEQLRGINDLFEEKGYLDWSDPKINPK